MAGKRILPMPPFVADALQLHQDAQAARLSLLDPPVRQTDSTAVIMDGDGSRMNSRKLYDHWERDRKSLGLDGWGLHELRHSYLSMLAAQGVHPKVMQELAGHSNSAITMEIYTHVNIEQKRGAADLVQAAINSGQNGPRRTPPAAAGAGRPALTIIKGGSAKTARTPTARAQ